MESAAACVIQSCFSSPVAAPRSGISTTNAPCFVRFGTNSRLSTKVVSFFFLITIQKSDPIVVSGDVDFNFFFFLICSLDDNILCQIQIYLYAYAMDKDTGCLVS